MFIPYTINLCLVRETPVTCDVLTLLVQKTIVIHTNIKRLIRNMAECGTVQKINVIESSKINKLANKIIIQLIPLCDSENLDKSTVIAYFTISRSAHMGEKS